MVRFIKEDDYGMLIKSEIQAILVTGYDDPKLVQAEQTAIAQMRNYLCGRYNIEKIFDAEQRDEFIVMTLIDIALYHLYSSKAASKLPEHRSQRYEDALTWLKGASKGTMSVNLPEKETTEAYSGDVRIRSHKKQVHKW